jgi:hypothetical protein
MDIGEAVTVTLGGLSDSKEKFCGSNPTDPPAWTARVDGYKGFEATPEELLSNMRIAKKAIPDPPPKKAGTESWDLFQCDAHTFPCQSHHVIPKKYLPKLDVCVWLTSDWTKHPKYQLESDAPFDTDGALNGYNMPFASNTAQWEDAGSNSGKQQKVCFEMMRRVGIQLHQGSHTATNYGEEDGIEMMGYLTFIKELLKIVFDETLKHVDKCETCKKDGSGGKIKVAPIESVAKHVYGVAGTTLTALKSNYIFVSKRAYEYWKEIRGTPVPPPFLLPDA